MSLYNPTALILLATYNGAEYLSEQIESIRGQDMEDWIVLVSDDGSSDETVSKLAYFVSIDSRVKLLPSRIGPRGHVPNFEFLLQSACSYNPQAIFLCDQDDMWNPGKLNELIQTLGGNSAAFSDVELFGDVKVPGLGLMQSLGLEPPENIYRLISQNSVAGCSMAIAPALLDLALPFPPGLRNHDWWLALCAMCTAGLGFNERMLTRYRQHRGNTIGGKNWIRQSRRLPQILIRQRETMTSKTDAIRELSRRLSSGGHTVPPALNEYLEQFQGAGRWRSVWRLCTGPFRPRSAPLLALQSAAILLR